MDNKLYSGIIFFIKKYHLEALKDVVIFSIILLFFHVIWKLFVSDFFSVSFIYDSANALAHEVFKASRWVLEALHVNVTTFDVLSIQGALHKNVIYYPENNGVVYVNASCSGLKQFYQWVILLLLYPGPWKHKAWFIPFGLLIIHLVNIFRILSMTFVTMNYPQHWNFIHDYVLRPFFYVVMFALWVWWNERFYHRKKLQPAVVSEKTE